MQKKKILKYGTFISCSMILIGFLFWGDLTVTLLGIALITFGITLLFYVNQK